MSKYTASFPYLYWRGRSLWSRKPWPDKPLGFRYPMNLKTDGTVSDKRRLELLAVENSYRPFSISHDTLFDSEKQEAPYRPTFRELAERYEELHVSLLKSAKGVKAQIKKVKDAFGDRYWDEVTKEEFGLWVKRIGDQGISVASLKVYISHAKSIFEFACEETNPDIRLPHNPLERYKPKLGQCNIRRHYVSPEHYTKYLGWFSENDTNFYPFFLAMVTTGRRPTEIASWCWDNVGEDQLPNGMTAHYVDVYANQTKTKRQDRVYLPARLWDAIKIQGWRAGLIFRDLHARKDANPEMRWSSDSWGYRVKRLKKAYPSDKTLQQMWPRDTRRGFITYNLEYAKERKSLNDVQTIVGHSSPNSTRRYTVPNKENMLRVIYPEAYKVNSTDSHSMLG